MNDTTEHIVHLNVGGVYFTTLRQTLHDSDCFFSGCLQHRPDCAEIFVDRDPTHFRHILNWLRGVKYLPQDESVLDELLWEADYYCITKMSEQIRRARKIPTMGRSLLNIHSEIKHMGRSSARHD